jgi:hypothetical protein
LLGPGAKDHSAQAGGEIEAPKYHGSEATIVFFRERAEPLEGCAIEVHYAWNIGNQGDRQPKLMISGNSFEGL